MEMSSRLQFIGDAVVANVLDRQAGAALCLVQAVVDSTTCVFAYLGPPRGRRAEVLLLARPDSDVLGSLLYPLFGSLVVRLNNLLANHR